jgi:hypothetical protein
VLASPPFSRGCSETGGSHLAAAPKRGTREGGPRAGRVWTSRTAAGAAYASHGACNYRLHPHCRRTPEHPPSVWAARCDQGAMWAKSTGRWISARSLSARAATFNSAAAPLVACFPNGARPPSCPPEILPPLLARAGSLHPVLPPRIRARPARIQPAWPHHQTNLPRPPQPPLPPDTAPCTSRWEPASSIKRQEGPVKAPPVPSRHHPSASPTCTRTGCRYGSLRSPGPGCRRSHSGSGRPLPDTISRVHPQTPRSFRPGAAPESCGRPSRDRT